MKLEIEDLIKRLRVLIVLLEEGSIITASDEIKELALQLDKEGYGGIHLKRI